MIGELVSGPMGVEHHEVEIGTEEGEVVVAAVPDDDVDVALGPLENRRIVDARVDRRAHGDVGLVLLALLDRGLRSVEIRVAGEALHRLLLEVAVGHRMPDGGDAQSPLEQPADDEAGQSALAHARAHRADREDRDRRLEHRRARPEDPEARARRERERRAVHHLLVRDVAVREEDIVYGFFPDHARELRFGEDRDAVGIEPAGE